MNFLAHAYLSFNQPQLLAGNMISDFIKGRRQFDYAAGIQAGITLHRAIDEFTDFHPVTQQAKEFFRPQYRLYSGPFIDIVYDHFLAIDKNEFATEQHLYQFTQATYALLTAQEAELPPPFRQMLPYMKAQNWLYNYRKPEGIRTSFQGLVRRAKYLNESDMAFSIFLGNYDSLKDCYHEFFPTLKQFVIEKMSSSS